MKDSQLPKKHPHQDIKYIKANNERFSTNQVVANHHQ